MIEIILPLFFAFCLAANTLNPPTNLPIQVLFACLLLTTSPSLYDLAFTLALGLSTVFLFKHGIVQFTKAVSGVNVGAGLRRVRSRLDEGLGKVAGSLMNIKDTVIPGTFGAVLVIIITVFAIATKPTMSAALGDAMTIFAFMEDSLVDGSTMDLQDKIPTGQASLQVDKYIKLALGVMVIHASTPVARIAEAMIKIALSFLDNVAHHVESYVCDLAVKFVQCIRHESGMVHAQDFNQSVAFAIFDKLDQSARTLYRFLTAFEAAISFSVTVISFAVKDLTKVSRACWKDDIVTFAQQTKIPVPNIVFFCLDASITILLQICLCMLDVLPSILRWTVRGFYTMALLVELVAHVLLRLWRLSEEWTCSWKAARVNNTDANANTAQDDHSTQVASPQNVALVDVSDETFNSEQTQERSASLVLQGSGMHTSAKTGLELDLLEEGDLERFLHPITSINATTISPQSIASPIYPVGRPECMSTEQEDTVTFAKTVSSNFIWDSDEHWSLDSLFYDVSSATTNIISPGLKKRHNLRISLSTPRKVGPHFDIEEGLLPSLFYEPETSDVSSIVSFDEEDLAQYTRNVAGSADHLEVDWLFYGGDLLSPTSSSRSDTSTETELPTPLSPCFPSAQVDIVSGNDIDDTAGLTDASSFPPQTMVQESVKVPEQVHGVDDHQDSLNASSRSIDDRLLDSLCEAMGELSIPDTYNRIFDSLDFKETILQTQQGACDTSDTEKADRLEPIQDTISRSDLGRESVMIRTNTSKAGTTTSSYPAQQPKDSEHLPSPTRYEAALEEPQGPTIISGDEHETIATPLEHDYYEQTINKELDLSAITSLPPDLSTLSVSAAYAIEPLHPMLPSPFHATLATPSGLSAQYVTSMSTLDAITSATTNFFSSTAMGDFHRKLAGLKTLDQTTDATLNSTGNNSPADVDEYKTWTHIMLVGISTFPLAATTMESHDLTEHFTSQGPTDNSVEISPTEEDETAPSASPCIDVLRVQVIPDTGLFTEPILISIDTPTNADADSATTLDLTSDDPPAAPALLALPIPSINPTKPCVLDARFEFSSEPECEDTPYTTESPSEQPNLQQFDQASQASSQSPSAYASTSPATVLVAGVPNVQVSGIQVPAVATAALLIQVEVPEIKMTAAYGDVPSLRIEFDQELHLGATFQAYPDSCPPADAALLHQAVEGPMDTSGDFTDSLQEITMPDVNDIDEDMSEIGYTDNDMPGVQDIDMSIAQDSDKDSDDGSTNIAESEMGCATEPIQEPIPDPALDILATNFIQEVIDGVDRGDYKAERAPEPELPEFEDEEDVVDSVEQGDSKSSRAPEPELPAFEDEQDVVDLVEQGDYKSSRAPEPELPAFEDEEDVVDLVKRDGILALSILATTKFLTSGSRALTPRWREEVDEKKPKVPMAASRTLGKLYRERAHRGFSPYGRYGPLPTDPRREQRDPLVMHP